MWCYRVVRSLLSLFFLLEDFVDAHLESPHPGTSITDYFSHDYDVIENGPYQVVVGLVCDFVAVNDSFLQVHLLFCIPLPSNLQVTSYLSLPYDHFKDFICLKAQYILIDALSLKGTIL
jgi:hypothetical protein